MIPEFTAGHTIEILLPFSECWHLGNVSFEMKHCIAHGWASLRLDEECSAFLKFRENLTSNPDQPPVYYYTVSWVYKKRGGEIVADSVVGAMASALLEIEESATPIERIA